MPRVVLYVVLVEEWLFMMGAGVDGFFLRATHNVEIHRAYPEVFRACAPSRGSHSNKHILGSLFEHAICNIQQCGFCAVRAFVTGPFPNTGFLRHPDANDWYENLCARVERGRVDTDHDDPAVTVHSRGTPPGDRRC